MSERNGYYIWVDDTCVAGPFGTESEAQLALDNRPQWTWAFDGGVESLLKLPIEVFTILYSTEAP